MAKQGDDFLTGLNIGDSSTINLENEDLLQFLNDSDSTGSSALEGVTTVGQEVEDTDTDSEKLSSKDFLNESNNEEDIISDIGLEKIISDQKSKKTKNSQEDVSEEEEVEKDEISEVFDEDENDSDDDNDDDNDDEDGLDVNSSFTNLFKALEKKGIFTASDEEWKVNSEEDIVNRLHEEGKIIASDYLEMMFSKGGEENRDFIEKVVLQGIPVKEYFNIHKESLNMDEMDLEDPKVLKDVYLQHQTKVLNISPEKAKKNLQRVVDSGDLEEEGKEAFDALKQNVEKEKEDFVKSVENKKNQILLQRQQAAQETQKIMDEALKTKNFNGIKITPQEAVNVLDYLNKDKYMLKDGNYLTEFEKDILELRRPENIKNKMMLAFLLKNKFNIERVNTDIKSEKSEAIYNTLVRKNKKSIPNNSQKTNRKNFF